MKENLPGLHNDFGSENSALKHAFSIVENPVPPISKRGHKIVAGPASEIPVGERKIVESDGLSLGVYNIRGEFFAIKNVCPHAGAPLCQGHIQTTHRPSAVGEFDPALEGRVLRCPWHGWEFDIVSGKALYDRNSRVAIYLVEVDEDGNVVVSL